MRMQREEKIVVILLLMALGSLAVAQWTFGDSDQSAASDKSGPSKSDSSISAEGHVLDIKPTKTGGNLLLRLDSLDLSVFIPRSSGADDVKGRIHRGDLVRIKGEISEYNGNQEIKIASASDIEVI
jgi:DNA/RNA endonuclease YhcR with UshA esterase domain